MSRRCFLGAVSAGAAAIPLTAAAAEAPPLPQGNLADYVDLGGLRPAPPVRVVSVTVRRAPPYWLGWPGTSYDVEGNRKAFNAAFKEAAGRVGVELEQVEAPLESAEAVEAFVAQLEDAPPDAVLISLQHLEAWRMADPITKCGVPALIFAPVGNAFTGHVLEISRRPGVHVMSTLHTEAVEQALRMIRTRKQIAATRVLVVRGEERKEEVLEGLGTHVRYIPRDSLHELFEQMPMNDEAHQVAEEMMRGADRIVEPTRADAENAARSYLTAKRLLRIEESNAITSDCLGMVSSGSVPTPPCMAAALFQDHGVTYGCEGDVFGAVSMLLVSYLLDKPGFMNDPVPETWQNVLIAAHCTSGTKLHGFANAAEPYVLRSHSESGIGVSMQVLWKIGQPVTLVRFTKPDQLILDTGTVVANVDTPPAGGCRTSFEIAMDRVDDVRDVAGFHQVVFYGNHRRDVEAFCQMYGINVIHSPEHPPVAKATTA